MLRTKIRELLQRETAGGDVLVKGWVKTRRSSKSVSFIQVSDGSSLQDIQVVADGSLSGEIPLGRRRGHTTRYW